MDWFLFNNNVVPVIQLNHEKEIISCIDKSIWELDVVMHIIKEKGWNSISNFAQITECPISSESQEAGPYKGWWEGVNDQIETDTEEWTPTVNCSNLLVLLYFSPNIKAVVNMKVLP